MTRDRHTLLTRIADAGDWVRGTDLADGDTRDERRRVHQDLYWLTDQGLIEKRQELQRWRQCGGGLRDDMRPVNLYRVA